MKRSGMGDTYQRRALETHLYVDLYWKRDSLLQLFGLLIEVLAELPDGDSSLGGK